jgi:hypothetical protein
MHLLITNFCNLQFLKNEVPPRPHHKKYFFNFVPLCSLLMKFKMHKTYYIRPDYIYNIKPSKLHSIFMYIKPDSHSYDIYVHLQICTWVCTYITEGVAS